MKAPAGHDMHFEAPAWLAKKPIAQGLQPRDAALSENQPLGQGVQSRAPGDLA